MLPVVFVVVVVGSVPGIGRAQSRPQDPVRIMSLSNRSDLISGGDALVEIVLPEGADAAQVAVAVDGRDVTPAFAVRSDRRFYGRVEGLSLGVNRFAATLPDGSGAYLDITNHPIGGPVLSGPQLQPWTCSTDANGLGPATDEQCNAPTRYDFYYVPVGAADGPEVDATIAYAVDSPIFQPYDPENPPDPSAIAMTTIDTGETVPYVVRRERSTFNRSISDFAVLFDPARPWEPWAPQAGWNHKLLWIFGQACDTEYEQGNPNAVLNDAALSRGFMVTAASMTFLGTHCNTTLEAETVLMGKERIVETYGEIRYTMGLGCSGGSIGQHGVANQYPGLLQGLLPQCSFPDFHSVGVADSFQCTLLNDYFNNVEPGLWADPVARNAVYGHQNGIGYCRSAYNPGVWDPDASCSSVPAERLYNAETNPDGVRCTIQDYHAQILGQRPPAVWTAQEQQIGHGFANRFLDNVGLQYGLQALGTGAITPEQFVDLNEHIRCWDIDANVVDGRCQADIPAVERMYQSGQIVYGNALADVAIIDARAGNNNDVHSNLHSETTRFRMQRANGHSLNRVSWYEPIVLPANGHPTPETALQAFIVLDRWLANVEADDTDTPLADKLVRDRPAEAVDGCLLGAFRPPPDACAESRVYFGDPLTVAGMPLTRDVLKCRLKPLNRGDYNVEFSDEQWTRLQEAFPQGVCDWSAPGVGQGPNPGWMTYAHGPGGEELGAAPVSVPFGAASVVPPESGPDGVPLPSTGGGVALPALGLMAAIALGFCSRRPRSGWVR